MNRVYPIVLLILAVCVQIQCTDRQSEKSVEPAGVTLADAVREEQGFVNLWGLSLPNTNVDVDWARRYFEPMDEDSIEMTVYRDQVVYSPVELCHRTFHFMGAYLKTGERQFLDRAEKYASKLLELSSVADDGSRFVEYRYQYFVHSNEDWSLNPPFSSGMAQGEMLSVLVRLHEFTDNPKYLLAASQIFRSLTKLRSAAGKLWVARLDSSGYYWMEEFPLDSAPGMTLNGYIAGLYGVYDYYRVTGDGTACAVWEAALTTLKHYLPEFRRPGQKSYYCLEHRHIASDGYHLLHAGMMGHLYRLTGDPYFDAMRTLLLEDVGLKSLPPGSDDLRPPAVSSWAH